VCLALVAQFRRAAFRGGFLVPLARYVAGATAALAGRDQSSVPGNEGWIAKARWAGLTVAAELEAIPVESHVGILAEGRLYSKTSVTLGGDHPRPCCTRPRRGPQARVCANSAPNARGRVSAAEAALN